MQSINVRVTAIARGTLMLCLICMGCQSSPPVIDEDEVEEAPLLPLVPLPDSPTSDPPSILPPDPPLDTPEPEPTAAVTILKNGHVMANPALPHKGHKYHFDDKPGDNDLPWLRQYAVDKGVFGGIDMSREWKEREWEMMKAIIRHTSHVLTFTGVNTDPDPEALFRAKLIFIAAEEHPDYFWSCGAIAQAAAGLAQAHGIPARMVNGTSLEDPCAGDYCCEMYSTRWNRWIFLMPHVYAWIEHETEGPLGVAQLRQYDLNGMIQATLIFQHDEQVLDANGNWITITVPMHYEAIPSPPLVFMPSIVNLAPISPYMTVNWWSGFFHRMSLSYTTTTQQGNPLMLQAFNDDSLNHTPCFFWDPIPVIPVDDPNITYPMTNVEASVEIVEGGVAVHLVTNVIDLAGFEMLKPDGQWQGIDVEREKSEGYVFLWHPAPFDTLSLRGVHLGGATSPEVIIHYSLAGGDLNADGGINGLDLARFVRAITHGNANTNVTQQGDFDGDSEITLQDLPYMISTLLAQ